MVVVETYFRVQLKSRAEQYFMPDTPQFLSPLYTSVLTLPSQAVLLDFDAVKSDKSG